MEDFLDRVVACLIIAVMIGGLFMVLCEPGCDYVDVSTENTTCTQIKVERCSLTSGEYSAEGALSFNEASGSISENFIYVVTYQREDNGNTTETLKLPINTDIYPIGSEEKPYIEAITKTPCNGGYNHNEHYLLDHLARTTIVLHVPQEVIDKLFS